MQLAQMKCEYELCILHVQQSIFHNRFCVMMTCWKENPDKRPTFDELVNTISSILKPLADYMDFSDVYCKENNTEESKYDRLGNKYDKLEKI